MVPIARLTFREVFHKRIFLMVVVMTAAFLVLYTIGLNYSYHDLGLQGGAEPEWWINNGLFVVEMFGSGMYFSSLILALLAIMASVGSIGPEIDNGLMFGILAKPISRREVILGKFMGYSLMLGVYGLVLFFAVYEINSVYMPSGVLELNFPYLLSAMGLYVLQAVILVGLGLFLSTRFDFLNAGVLAVILYGIGLVGGVLEQIGAFTTNTGLINIGIITSLVMPVDAVYRKMLSMFLIHNQLPLALVGPGIFGSSSIPSATMILYALAYTGLLVLLATRTFAGRDL